MMEDVLIIRTDGTEETHSIPGFRSNYDGHRAALVRLLKFDKFDIVNLRDGRCMYVDDEGYKTETVTHPGLISIVPVQAKKPYNRKATELYWAICKPGTTHQIV